MKYRILLIWVGLFAFTTLPGQPSAGIRSVPNSFQFYLIGDWGRKGQALVKDASVQQQEKLANAMDHVGNLVPPEMIISAGDNFYSSGVKSDSDPRWKETFEDVYRGKNLQRPWYIVLGNHDHGGSVQAQIDYGKKPNSRWHLPASYYSETKVGTDGARIKFIFIDTTPLIKGDDPGQISWLTTELSDTTCAWKFVVGHHPLYSGNQRFGEQTKLRTDLEKLFILLKVDAYLCGHDHNLQHIKKDKIHYFISGAGSEIYPSERLPGLTEYVYCKEGMDCNSAFITFSVSKKSVLVQMIDANEKLLYNRTLAR